MYNHWCNDHLCNDHLCNDHLCNDNLCNQDIIRVTRCVTQKKHTYYSAQTTHHSSRQNTRFHQHRVTQTITRLHKLLQQISLAASIFVVPKTHYLEIDPRVARWSESSTGLIVKFNMNLLLKLLHKSLHKLLHKLLHILTCDIRDCREQKNEVFFQTKCCARPDSTGTIPQASHMV